jgi:hypothetical protein
MANDYEEDLSMAIIGAILGDIAGAQYEYDRPHDLDYEK